MNVVVNGKRRTVPDGCTAAQLVEQMSVPARGVAVAVNGEVLPRTAWDSALAEDAAVEVLTAVQGG